MENAQPTSCVTVNVCPAAVSVPERAGPEFGATEKLTVPLPAPLAPAVIVIQLTLLTAIQLHPAPDVTVTDPGPPPAPTFIPRELIANVQGGGGGVVFRIVSTAVEGAASAAPVALLKVRLTVLSGAKT